LFGFTQLGTETIITNSFLRNNIPRFVIVLAPYALTNRNVCSHTYDIELHKCSVLDVRMSDKGFPFNVAPTYSRTKSNAHD
jgi:hypothetical protein